MSALMSVRRSAMLSMGLRRGLLVLTDKATDKGPVWLGYLWAEQILRDYCLPDAGVRARVLPWFD